MAKLDMSKRAETPFLLRLREAMIRLPNASPYHFANRFDMRVTTVRRWRNYWAGQGYPVDSLHPRKASQNGDHPAENH